jgi:hypothetical protein
MGLKNTFEKQGGKKLIKQYFKSGALFTAVGQFLLLGKSRTALEILRLSTQLKAKRKLYKKYANRLEEFEKLYDSKAEHKKSDKVWVCWFQGMENAPALVQKCYNSLLDNLKDKEIILITMENISQYVDFPDFILEKWKSGQITNTHMTDLLRLELLLKHGGTWIDSTVLCTEKQENIPSYFFESDLFFFQCLKPGRDGHSSYISSWFMSAETNNKILAAARYLCYEYWNENKDLIDYFLLHDFLSIILDRYPESWKKIVPRDNATPHILLLRLFEEYDEDIWNAVKAQTPFHKLTYKFTEEQEQLEGTYYKAVLKQ